ncbi:MAG: 4Fe-4S dicluster domain-containing protein [Candidatus Heimdallarchaeota archaeon]
MTKRIGVFVCHCGHNIAGTVDIKEMIRIVRAYPGVAHVEDYVYMCSDPGQKLIETTIREKKLEGVVVACCSPTLHEETFRKACERSGLNPYQCEIANIREKCSWVHSDKIKATKKAIKITNSIIEKVTANQPLDPIRVGVSRKCLVIGGGIAGIQAALDVAEMGNRVILVEKSPTIGGHMAQLSETFPTLDCSQCILTPKMVQVSRHPNIELLTYSEIQEISGYVGNFKVKILKKPRYVDPDKCTLCDDCSKVCPEVVPSEFNVGLSPRKAIYIPFPQAIPATYTLDENACLGLNPLRCNKCQEACLPGAIDYDMVPEIIEEDIGAIIVATGYDQYGIENMAEYGYGTNPDVITGLEFERLLSASGPTQGQILRPSDGTIPKEVVFIQCSGSRDPEQHMPYCSKICCMYTAKHALLYKHLVHGGQAYVFYIDIRAGGKDYEEFINHVMEEERILYLRGKVAKVFRQSDKTVVWGVDTLTGKKIEIEADLVVLAQAIVPREDSKDLIKMLKIATGPSGFLKEAHPKLRPVESLTSGIFLAGAIQGPKDIPEAVAQASGAASKATAILAAPELTHDPATAVVDEWLCTGCSICVELCPFNAITVNKSTKLAEVNKVLCEGCGTCAVGCTTGAITLINMTEGQITKMIETMIRG